MGSHSSAHIVTDPSRTNNDLEDAKSSIVAHRKASIFSYFTKNIQA